MLADQIRTFGVKTWLVNTGWLGGSFGTGERIKLSHTRALIDAIHLGYLTDVDYQIDPVFGLSFPKNCPNIPSDILNPRSTWADPTAYDKEASRLAQRFRENFSTYASFVDKEVVAAGPLS